MEKYTYTTDIAGAKSVKAKLIASRIITTQSSAGIYDSSTLHLPFQPVLNSRPASLTSLGYLNYPIVRKATCNISMFIGPVVLYTIHIYISQANKNHDFPWKASKGPHSGTEWRNKNFLKVKMN